MNEGGLLKNNVKKGVISIGIGILSTVGIATCFGATKEKIQEAELEKISKSYVTANDNKYKLEDLYIIESNGDVNICEIRTIDTASEEEETVLEGFNIDYYNDFISMPKDISYRVKFFEKDEQQDIFDVKGWFRFDDHNDENLITLYDTIVGCYDIDSGKFVKPFSLRNDVVTAEWVLPKDKLLFEDNEFTYDEVKGYAKTYFKK